MQYWSRQRTSYVVLAALLVLLSLAACSTTRARDKSAWGQDLEVEFVDASRRLVSTDGGPVPVEVYVDVSALACPAFPSYSGDLAPLTGCGLYPNALEGDEDITKLTSSGSVSVSFDRLALVKPETGFDDLQWVSQDSLLLQVPDIKFGETTRLGPVVFNVPPAERVHEHLSRYGIRVKGLGCRLSNESACGNDDARYGFDVFTPEMDARFPDANDVYIPDPESTPVARPTVPEGIRFMLEVQGDGWVTVTPPGERCGPNETCTYEFDEPTDVSMITDGPAVPGSSDQFDHWEKGCAGLHEERYPTGFTVLRVVECVAVFD